MKRALWLLALMLALNVHAKEAPPVAEDPALEIRLNNLAKELRCLVCQNETLADSHADLAVDLRREIRGKMREGMSDREITEYLTQRYGNFVLYRPPMRASTWVLWFGPFMLLGAGAAGLIYFLKRRRRALPDTALSAEEAARLQSALSQKPEQNS